MINFEFKIAIFKLQKIIY